MKSVALCLPLLAACYGATPSKSVRISLPPPDDAQVVPVASYVEAQSLSAQIRLPSWAHAQPEAAPHDNAFRAAAKRRRLPSMTSRSAGVIATKRVATTAMWSSARRTAM